MSLTQTILACTGAATWLIILAASLHIALSAIQHRIRRRQDLLERPRFVDHL